MINPTKNSTGNQSFIIIFYGACEKSNNPNVLAAGPLKTLCRLARSTSCSQWTGMMSFNDYSFVYNEKRNYM